MGPHDRRDRGVRRRESPRAAGCRPGPMGERIAVPALFPFPATTNLVVRAARGNPGHADVVLGAVGRMLASVPPGQLRLSVIDPLSLGRSVRSLVGLNSEDVRLLDDPLIEPRLIEDKLGELIGRISRVDRDLLGPHRLTSTATTTRTTWPSTPPPPAGQSPGPRPSPRPPSAAHGSWSWSIRPRQAGRRPPRCGSSSTGWRTWPGTRTGSSSRWTGCCRWCRWGSARRSAGSPASPGPSASTTRAPGGRRTPPRAWSSRWAPTAWTTSCRCGWVRAGATT